MKITIIGAGSDNFGSGMVCDAVNTPEIRGAELCLMDINQEHLQDIFSLAVKLNQALNSGLIISKTTDRVQALEGADFVIISVAVDRNKTWKMDWEIPIKYGVKHVLGENGGPGGFFHSARNIPLLLDIVKDVERICPQALVMNFTNPMSRVCLAISKYTKVKFIGLCHGVGMGIERVAPILGMKPEELSVLNAGLNHYTWFLKLQTKETGEDLYPLLRERNKTYDPSYCPLMRRLFEIYGYWPSPSDDHIGEYLPWAWKYSGMHGYNFEKADLEAKLKRENLRAIAEGRAELGKWLKLRSGEIPFEIISHLVSKKRGLHLAVNVPNKGYIENLPDGAIVEVPAETIDGKLVPLKIGKLPEGIAALCRIQLAIQELVVQAICAKSKKLALQALLADPVVPDIETAENILEELLLKEAEYLDIH